MTDAEVDREDGDVDVTAGGDVDELMDVYRTARELREAEELLADGGVTPSIDRSETIEVADARSGYDTYGGRQSDGSGQKTHMGNTNPPAPGWLGNPYEMQEDTVEERRRVIASYLVDFAERIESDAEFRRAVESLRGQTVACWCRGVTQERQPDNWCHLDVVRCWLDGDLSPVLDYLRGGR